MSGVTLNKSNVLIKTNLHHNCLCLYGYIHVVTSCSDVRTMLQHTNIDDTFVTDIKNPYNTHVIVTCGVCKAMRSS